MKTIISKSIVCLVVLSLLISIVGSYPVFASEAEETVPLEAEPVQIYTAQQLQQIADDPSGSYILMEDLDMTGIEWKPLDFSGSFDGNGHAVLNLTLSEFGDQTATTYDGNRKPYDTSLVGFFGVLRNAQVRNLKIINVRSVVETDQHCFVGGLAGFAENSIITDCSITGCLELRAHYKMFGVAGIVGYGTGTMERCTADVTLICTDTDSENRDEQFLGGALGAGLMHIKDSNITIDGYISEFGYVHSGGVVGMTLAYPEKPNGRCQVTGNTVTGKITFFESNRDRRAYCKAIIGEDLAGCNTYDSKKDFQRDERKVYDVELRPEMCANPVYDETVVPAGCDTYGYTSYTCQSCGYTYTDHYTLFEHTVTKWTLKEVPTTELEGLSIGFCDNCGMEFTRIEEKLEPTEPPTEAHTEPTEPVETEPLADEEPKKKIGFWLPMAVAVIAAMLCMIVVSRKRKKGKFEKA